MELNRNHYLVVGLILLALGIQLRLVDTFVLTPAFTNYLAHQTNNPAAAVTDVAPISKSIQPPQWVGWALLSLGTVLILHAISLPKPAG